MCGRYSNHVKAMLDWSTLLGEWPDEIPESNNISPGQALAVFTAEGGHAMRWGLIPGWANEASTKYATFNARIETAASKPAFRSAWRQKQTCLVPALGYYEWQRVGTTKQPHFIRNQHSEPLLFAGLYENGRGQEFPMSCTLLTCPAREDLAAIHPRMPIMLTLEQASEWLQSAEPRSESLVARVSDLPLRSYPVSTRVNNARNEGDDLLKPLPQ